VVQLEPPKDVETYIHRAGRTGRAGRSGVCVTFYTDEQSRLLSRIEQVAQIKMKDTQVPNPKDRDRDRERER
jgi:ATP-dependent RNA helicase DDX21